ncbi:MAG: hypothetical protein JWR07_1810 [Nevskia sp.]|nr:hypothetical protein [Nevskia sp.]
MTSRDRGHSKQLFQIQNWLAEETWKASDAELLDDLKAADQDLESESERFDAILKRAEAQAGKARLAAAKLSAQQDEGRKRSTQSAFANPQSARAMLNQVAANNPQFRDKLMLAARNAKTSLGQLPDSDVQSWIEMAHELGLLPSGGESG